MTEREIKMLARKDKPQAIELARLFNFEALAEALEAGTADIGSDIREYRGNPFQLAYGARFNLADLGRATGIPVSTVQAAAGGRLEGNMTDTERKAMAGFLWEKWKALSKALVAVDPAGAKARGLE